MKSIKKEFNLEIGEYLENLTFNESIKKTTESNWRLPTPIEILIIGESLVLDPNPIWTAKEHGPNLAVYFYPKIGMLSTESKNSRASALLVKDIES